MQVEREGGFGSDGAAVAAAADSAEVALREVLQAAEDRGFRVERIPRVASGAEEMTAQIAEVRRLVASGYFELRPGEAIAYSVALEYAMTSCRLAMQLLGVLDVPAGGAVEA